MTYKFLIVALFLMFVSTVSALTVDLTTPSVTFRVNESEIISHYIGVHNPNDFAVDVNLVEPEGINLGLESTYYHLEPGESYQFPYSFEAKESFQTTVGVVFSSDEGNFGLQSSIKAYVTPNEDDFSILSTVIFAIVLLIIILLIFKRMKGGNKHEKDFEFDADNNVG